VFCSDQVQESFSIFFDLKHEYWVFHVASSSIQLAAWAWNHFPTKRNHLRVQLLDAIKSQIEETLQ